MMTCTGGAVGIARRVSLGVLLMGLGLSVLADAAHALTVEVVGPDGAPIQGGFRYLIEEDATFVHTPNTPSVDILAYNFHRSYMPPVLEGTAAGSSTMVDDTSLVADRHFVSVLPMSGYSMGGAAVVRGQDSVRIIVHALPVPTAQIVIDVFNDHSPVNNQREDGPEEGLAGFELIVEDAAGRYGASGAQQTTDAFGNPLGTTYNGDGSVAIVGDGTVETDANGRAVIGNLAPGKYGIRAAPPRGTNWIQTTTLEGSPIIDAWVKVAEPPYFAEFGPPGPHIEFGFTRPFTSPLLAGSTTIEGKVVNLHNSRPPDYTFYAGGPTTWTECYVALNAGPAGVDGNLYVGQCDVDGSFAIPNVPAGDYQLAIWDTNLDYVFAFYDVSVTADGRCSTENGSCNLQHVPVFDWFHRLETRVFADANADGFRDPGEQGLQDVAVNLLWRDGTLYQSQLTDAEGKIEFNEVFPFFHWLLAEVDGVRLSPSGVTTVSDGGGPVPEHNGWTMPSFGQLNPLEEAPGQFYATEAGPILTRAFQGFLGQTNIIEWGKTAPTNPTISGMVRYAVTRAENDPRFAATEPWEPGIPRVPVFLYPKAAEDDGVLDLADVDHFPFGWSTGGTRGEEDIARAVRPEGIDPQTDAVFRLGEAIGHTATDSWDDNLPTGCKGPGYTATAGGQSKVLDCYDGLRNYNQVRAGVFDGGYGFEPPGPGQYIVEAVLPAPYQVVKEEDRNVDYGEDYVPNPDLLPPACVGDGREVAATLSLFESDPAPFAGETRPLCDRKLVSVTGTQNALADFYGFTLVPISSHYVGMVLNDLANEFDPTSPQFGEKYAPKWVPIAVRDWTGREIDRIYTDEHGRYNGLMPSTFTANLPTPSGISPQMVQMCMNDPGPLADGTIDPNFDRRYSQFCYTFQFMPGTTTYLDTPVVPVAAHASADASPLDCEYSPGVPKVASVFGQVQGLPLITDATAQSTVTITAVGETQVPDPNGDGQVIRDYSFGDQVPVVKFRHPAWAADVEALQVTEVERQNGLITKIEATLPAFAATDLPRRVQVIVERTDTLERSLEAASLWLSGATPASTVTWVSVEPGDGTPVQDAIDGAAEGTVVFLKPGTYGEMPILHKTVHLQGAGPGAVTLLPAKYPSEKLHAWRQRLRDLVAGPTVDLLPTQALGADEGTNAILGDIEGAAIVVMGTEGKTKKVPGHGEGPSVDGMTIIGGDNTGVIVNGYVAGFSLTNVSIVSNQGFFGGGVRVGHPFLVDDNQGVYVNGQNPNLTIAYSRISQNGTRGAAGGGIALYTGADAYRIHDNFICGNFAQAHGGGIGHYGLSPGGEIRDNQILFNQSFDQAQTVTGGGVFIGGLPALTPDGVGEGSGTVVVDANVIHGNHAGAGDGGGISLLKVSGPDVGKKKGAEVYVTNNMITNNVTGLAGGAIALKDTFASTIVHNTIVNNESTATAGEAFTAGQPNQSNPQPGGIASRRHGLALAALLKKTDPVFSLPDLRNNILRDNYSYTYTMADGSAPELVRVTTAMMAPWQENLGIMPLADGLVFTGARNNLMGPGSLGPYAALNSDGTVSFVNSQLNGEYTNGTKEVEVKTGISAQPALDEGGNFIDVRFAPLSVNAADGLVDYHVTTNPLQPLGDPTVLDPKLDAVLSGLALYDIDGQDRSVTPPVIVGADTKPAETTALNTQP